MKILWAAISFRPYFYLMKLLPNYRNFGMELNGENTVAGISSLL